MKNENPCNCVHIAEEIMRIPTYREPEREQLPMFAENRVHQRTSGRVYPVPIINRVIRDRKIDKEYKAIVLENEYIHLIILPELGGRIFEAVDKTNGYDFFYRQHVIKPALIGLFGSWISGGAEFNWPVHHRPSTFMPVDHHIEKADDGSITVWLSEHEPLHRMKGMVGICLHPGKAIFETKVRLYNRTALPQSFLWWENIAVPVNTDYQIFFPHDVTHVHFHYKKSVASFPVAKSVYNGIDMRNGRDIRWHRNTVQPTSFFASRSKSDYFGGYDHGKKAGVVHIANHHISPGKKLFTWGYNQLSRSWEKALTDTDGAYAELMAGVYSDNQPDFSWLEPHETKTFSQYWYPLKQIGEPRNANRQAAFNYEKSEGRVEIRLNVTESFPCAVIQLFLGDERIWETVHDLLPGEPYVAELEIAEDIDERELVFDVKDALGNEIIGYRHQPHHNVDLPEPARTVPPPCELHTSGELYLAGLHLEQYRDPCVSPEAYWRAALEKDPGHALSNIALGRLLLKRYRFWEAEELLVRAVNTLTTWNPNPRNGEAYYYIGLSLKYQNKLDEAYNAFYKATWNYAYRNLAFYALAEIDCLKGDFHAAREHLESSLDTNTQDLKARDLLAVVLRKLNYAGEAANLIRQTLAIDPLDYWAQNEIQLIDGLEADRSIFDSMDSNPEQTCLDIAFDYSRAGFFVDAIDLLQRLIKYKDGVDNICPMLYYAIGYFYGIIKSNKESEDYYKKARAADPRYCFPSRLEEMLILRDVLSTRKDARAACYLGNLLYDKQQYDKAIECWELSANLDGTYYVAFRNLSLGYFNQKKQPDKALAYLKKALTLKPNDTQLIYELNYLMELSGISPSERLDMLETHSEM